MSFGFAREDEGICDAIDVLRKERNDEIIFLASAGNTYTDEESFPARHPAVISVFATNRYGQFLQSNATRTSSTAIAFGIFGEDIPEYLWKGFDNEEKSNACQPGSSVATAILAGVSATMLAYTDTLYSFAPHGTTSSRVLQCLRTSKGMEAMLYRMPRPQRLPDALQRKAVNPIQFWKDSPRDLDRFCAIYDALQPVYDKMSLSRSH